MKILAIETSCDETAAAVVENGRTVRSSAVYSQIAEHREYGGVVPEIASRRHDEQILPVTRAALTQAGAALADMDAVAVTAAPGLIGALLVGLGFAKGLCLSAGKPLIPVHHLRGHVASNYIAHRALEPPFLCLVVSGGHSHIVGVDGYTDFRVIGKTRDDAAGECFDKVARLLGLPYPGGVELDRLSQRGSPLRYRFPHPRVESSPYDVSFSGLKTAAINLLHSAQQRGEEIATSDFAASFIHTVTDILCSRFFAAAKEFGYKALACAGGVCANSRLRAQLAETAAREGLPLYLPPPELCGDNAAMVGAQAYYECLAGADAAFDLNACASMDIGKLTFATHYGNAKK